MSESQQHFSRRERQIMDVLYRLKEATAKEVMDAMPNAPSYSTVRALLKRMEDKGHVNHRQDGPRYIFFASLEHDTASENALTRTLKTFFNDSPLELMNTLLGIREKPLSDEEASELKKMIDKAKERGF